MDLGVSFLDVSVGDKKDAAFPAGEQWPPSRCKVCQARAAGDVGNGAPQACDIPMAICPLKTRVPSLCVK